MPLAYTSSHSGYIKIINLYIEQHLFTFKTKLLLERLMRILSLLLPMALMASSMTFSNSIAADAPVFSHSKTSLNRCPQTDRYAFKREKLISEKCPSRAGFHVFIEGATEETLKFVLEKELAEPLIWDDPDARQIRVRGRSDSDTLLNGEITGTYIEWFYREKQFIGLVLKRLQGEQRRFEAFRFVEKQEDSYFCHLGGDKSAMNAGDLIRDGKDCQD